MKKVGRRPSKAIRYNSDPASKKNKQKKKFSKGKQDTRLTTNFAQKPKLNQWADGAALVPAGAEVAGLTLNTGCTAFICLCGRFVGLNSAARWLQMLAPVRFHLL